MCVCVPCDRLLSSEEKPPTFFFQQKKVGNDDDGYHSLCSVIIHMRTFLFLDSLLTNRQIFLHYVLLELSWVLHSLLIQLHANPL